MLAIIFGIRRKCLIMYELNYNFFFFLSEMRKQYQKTCALIKFVRSYYAWHSFRRFGYLFYVMFFFEKLAI